MSIIDPGFASEAEGIFRLPVAEFSQRNAHLERLLRAHLHRADAYAVNPHPGTGHGLKPGTACKGINAFLKYCGRNEVLLRLSRRVERYRSLCLEPRTGELPLNIHKFTLRGYQSNVPWDFEGFAKWYVGLAGGQLAYDLQSEEFRAAYQKFLRPGADGRNDFAQIFSVKVFDLKSQLSEMMNGDSGLTFGYRVKLVEKVIRSLN